MIHLKEIVFSSSNKVESRKIHNDLKRGLLRPLATRIFTSNLDDTPENIINRNWFIILSHLFPDAILAYRSAIEVKPFDGHIYLAYKYSKNITLPGLTIHLIKGPEKKFGAVPFFGNLHRSTEPRLFLENLQRTRGNNSPSKTLTQEDLENKLDTIIRTRGEHALNKVREEARILAPSLHMEREFEELNKIIGALLSTKPSNILNSELAIARAYGEPFDPERDAIFTELFLHLNRLTFKNYKNLNTTEKSYNAFAFFESYFSNFIEGTEFEIDEARQIISTGIPIPMRDEDSHDILGTYRIVSDPTEMRLLPTSPNQLLTLLRSRHETLLSARISKKPGEFKQINNRAGNTEFVDWQLVNGTLKRGFEYYMKLSDPFARACFIMFLVSEVHPFLDGNGRLARIMMNAELSSKDQSKIIIPTVYRTDYIGAIRKLTRQGDPSTYIKMLTRAYQFSSTIHGEDMNQIEAYLKKCNAFESAENYILRF